MTEELQGIDEGTNVNELEHQVHSATVVETDLESGGGAFQLAEGFSVLGFEASGLAEECVCLFHDTNLRW